MKGVLLATVVGGGAFVLWALYRRRGQSGDTLSPNSGKSPALSPSLPALTPNIDPQVTPESATLPAQSPTDDPRYQNPSQPMTQRYGPEWYAALRQRITEHCWKSATGKDMALKALEDAYTRCKTSAVFCELYASTLGDLTNQDRVAFIDEYKKQADALINEFVWGPVRQVAFLNRQSEYFTPDSKVASQVDDILLRMKRAQMPIPEVFWGVINPDTPKEPSLSVAVSLLRRAGVEVSPEDAVIGEKNWARRNAALNQQALRLWEVAPCK